MRQITIIKVFLFLCYIVLSLCSDTLMPMLSVQLGEPATFTCTRSNATKNYVYWYKQSPGDNLRLIGKSIIKQEKSTKPEFGPEFSDSRWKIDDDKKISKMSILKTTEEDEGTYHCVVSDWKDPFKWNGTYLIVKGKYYK
uniref:Ig-like domain-containing protein n=1 Tax=Kryptolebias marmoratus TaxID=37003 RepID=A0A3Q3B712_KRYMA